MSYSALFMNDALCLSSNSNNEQMLCFKLRAFGSNLYQQSQGLTCYMAQAETSSHYIMVPAFQFHKSTDIYAHIVQGLKGCLTICHRSKPKKIF